MYLYKEYKFVFACVKILLDPITDDPPVESTGSAVISTALS